MNQSTRIAFICLAVCTVFLSTAYGETCSFMDTCTEPQVYYTSCGFWGWGSCTAYRIKSYSCYKTSTCTYSLRSCGPCSVTCGNGTQDCTYECRSEPFCTLPDMIKIQSCIIQACPVVKSVDGGWGSWASWTSECACSVTCGGGTNITTRKRYCDSPVPQNGGAQCKGISTDYQTFSCSQEPCPVDKEVNGNWSAWNGWTSFGTCTVSCGTGMQLQTRNRTCTNPIPKIGGRQCNGTSTESQTSECNTQACPVDGNWGAWNMWSSNAPCSATCGGGTQIQTRNRSCNNPTPQSGGSQCNGILTESQTIQCCPQICPLDGSWSSWNGWVLQGACSVTCGEGLQVQTRNRFCTNPTPQYGGRPCNGTSADSQRIQCMKQSCPVDGNWGAWNSWTSNATCSVTCGTGVKTETRNRTCSNPIPQNGGRQCNGTSVECQTMLCNATPCAINGNWGAWNSWTSNATCSLTCGTGVKTETRTRTCSNPTPQYGGTQCNGTSTEFQTSGCNTNPCPIDGNWGAWNSWTSNATCSVTCGTGVKTETRNRTCSNPMPQNGGRQCNGTSTEFQTSGCNTNPCPIAGGWSAWNSWISAGTCNVTCSGCNEIQTRNRTCSNPIPQNGGRQCNGTSNESQTIPCSSSACPVVDGGWSQWCDWITESACSATCGGGTKPQRRTRTCSNQWPMNGGKQCIGSSAETRIVQCNPLPCPPVDGLWGEWTAWTSNSNWNVTCLNGKQIRTRTRFCNRPSPQNCGRPCNGSSVESVVIQCNKQTCPPECNTSSETTVTRDISSGTLNRDLMTSGNVGSECNSLNCTCDQISHGYVRHPTDCTKFIICAWNVKFVDTCKNGTYWDQRQLACRKGTC